MIKNVTEAVCNFYLHMEDHSLVHFSQNMVHIAAVLDKSCIYDSVYVSQVKE